jgi:hypothetical protein
MLVMKSWACAGQCCWDSFTILVMHELGGPRGRETPRCLLMRSAHQMQS